MNWILDERKPDTNRDVLLFLVDDRGHSIFRVGKWDVESIEPDWIFDYPDYYRWFVQAWCDIEGPQIGVQP